MGAEVKTSHILACKNVKFTMKLSATRHAALGRCGELRKGLPNISCPST